jgi:homoserine dehydrogenase
MRRAARVLLAGPGHVGTAFWELASARPDLEVAGVVRSTGATLADLLERGSWDVVADATPSGLDDGGPALAHARLALSRGIPFATAAKGPLVCGYRELIEIAGRTGAGFRFSAATGAGLPTVDTVEFALAGARVLSFEGVLNGTSNYVLDRMAAGEDMETALAKARELGIADGDGRQDISGVDTAAKVVAIANAIWSIPIELADVSVLGIAGLGPAEVQAAAAAGGAIRLVGTACMDEGRRPEARVAPTMLAATQPLAAVRGSEKAITFETTTMGRLTLSGGASDPRAAGAALLRDVLLLLRLGGRVTPPLGGGG